MQYGFNIFRVPTGQLVAISESQRPYFDLQYLGTEVSTGCNAALNQYLSRQQVNRSQLRPIQFGITKTMVKSELEIIHSIARVSVREAQNVIMESKTYTRLERINVIYNQEYGLRLADTCSRR